jgi:undecaprenyl diphosphate synthase
VDYSSRDAIARAAAGIVVALSPNGPTSSDLLRSMLAHALTAESGKVDLMIRTGGEKRLSDFLLWESAYAELLFTDRTWPEFDVTDLDAALAEFRRRERRFGSVPAGTTASHTVCGSPRTLSHDSNIQVRQVRSSTE